MTNKWNQVLYTGVTSDLPKRVFEHKCKLVDGFTKRYNVNKLVHFEADGEAIGAIQREKQIKGMTRIKKLRFINKMNPE